MSSLSEKIRRSRESVIDSGGFSFTIRRPTDIEMLEVSRTKRPSDFLRFVVGWSGVKEIDLIPGGDPTPAIFDADACDEWLSDRTDLFTTVVNSIVESYQKHKEGIEVPEKN